MRDPVARNRRRVITGLAALAGPSIAALFEMDALPIGNRADFIPLAMIVLVAGIGLTIGLGGTRRRPRWLGVLASVTNGLVLMLYGFFLAFFGLGGSR